MNGILTAIEVFIIDLADVLFTPQLKTYEYATLFNNIVTLRLFVFGLYFGAIAAALVMFYNKNILGGMIRRLDGCGCLSHDTAKGLDELGYKNPGIAYFLLRIGGSLKNNVFVAFDDGEDMSVISAAYAKKKYDKRSAKYYIPAKKRDVLIQRFDKRGSGWLSLVLTAAVGFVAVILLFKLAPFIAELTDNAVRNLVGGAV